MYYKTKSDSETGRKFAEFIEKVKQVDATIQDFLDEIGATTYSYDSNKYVTGGILALDNVTNIEGWRRSRTHGNYFIPDLKKKTGKAIRDKIASIPEITRRELNLIVDYKSIFGNIGFSYRKEPEFYFFAVPESAFDKNYVPPADCIEITYSEYRLEQNKSHA